MVRCGARPGDRVDQVPDVQRRTPGSLPTACPLAFPLSLPLPCSAFLTPLEEDEEVEFEIAKGVAANIKYKAVGELQPNGGREGRR